jgi:hypothetical protein
LHGSLPLWWFGLPPNTCAALGDDTIEAPFVPLLLHVHAIALLLILEQR